MHQVTELKRRVLNRAKVSLERSAAKVARCVLRGPGEVTSPSYPAGAPFNGARRLFSERTIRGQRYEDYAAGVGGWQSSGSEAC
jgi:hypothetical protein